MSDIPGCVTFPVSSVTFLPLIVYLFIISVWYPLKTPPSENQNTSTVLDCAKKKMEDFKTHGVLTVDNIGVKVYDVEKHE